MHVDVDSQKLDKLLECYDRKNTPGFVVGIAVTGAPVYRRGFGLANLDLPIVLTPTTRLRIGSTSKHFTALAIFLLAEDGKLSPDDSIRLHVPSLPAWADEITLHQLITHTSGIRCSLDVLSLTSGIMSTPIPLPHDDQIKLLTRLQSTNFEPGTSWCYCNGGYALLTKVIELRSGLAYGEFVRSRILYPAGMFETEARPLDTDFLPGSATMHLLEPNGSYRRGVFGPYIGGEGNLVSTVDDMLRWLGAMRRKTIGSGATWRYMLQSATIGDTDIGYAAGLTLNHWRGVDTISHSGHVVGGSSHMLTVPSHQLDVIVMSNTSAIDSVGIANVILDACIQGLEPDERSKSGKLSTGNFLSAETGRFVSIVEKDGATAVDFDPVAIPVRFQSDGSGWVPSNMMSGALLKNAAGAIEWHECGTVDLLRPVEAVSDDGGAALAGDYASQELDAKATISAEGKLSIWTEAGCVRYRLRRKGTNLWTLVSEREGWIGTLERDGNCLLLSSLRTRRLRFEQYVRGDACKS
jgi:CubicO group peptidase (beta-lactamase class C family)